MSEKKIKSDIIDQFACQHISSKHGASRLFALNI